MLTPSIGFCGDAVDGFGSAMPATSRMVGTMSMTWWNWERSSPVG